MSEQHVRSPGCDTSVQNVVPSQRGGQVADRLVFTPLPRKNEFVHDALAQNAAQVEESRQPTGRRREGIRLARYEFESGSSTSTATGTTRTTGSLSSMSAEHVSESGQESGVAEFAAAEKQLVHQGVEDKSSKARTQQELPLPRDMNAGDLDQHRAEARRRRNKLRTEGDLPQVCGIIAAGEQVLPPSKLPGRHGRRPLGRDRACLFGHSTSPGSVVSRSMSVVLSDSEEERDGHYDVSAQAQHHASGGTPKGVSKPTIAVKPEKFLSPAIAVGGLPKKTALSESPDHRAGWRSAMHLEEKKKEEDEDEEAHRDENEQDGYSVHAPLEGPSRLEFAKSTLRDTPDHVGSMSAVTVIVGKCQAARGPTSPRLRLPALASAVPDTEEAMASDSNGNVQLAHGSMQTSCKKQIGTTVAHTRLDAGEDREVSQASDDEFPVPVRSQRLRGRPAELAAAAEARALADMSRFSGTETDNNANRRVTKEGGDEFPLPVRSRRLCGTAAELAAAAAEARALCNRSSFAAGDADDNVQQIRGSMWTRCAEKHTEAAGTGIKHEKDVNSGGSQESDDEFPRPVRSRRLLRRHKFSTC